MSLSAMNGLTAAATYPKLRGCVGGLLTVCDTLADLMYLQVSVFQNMSYGYLWGG